MSGVVGAGGWGATLVELRPAGNEMICLADDPRKEEFSAACYHKDLEPYMARGRELLAQGVTGKRRNDIRWKEVEEGKLPMPRLVRPFEAGLDATTTVPNPTIVNNVETLSHVARILANGSEWFREAADDPVALREKGDRFRAELLSRGLGEEAIARRWEGALGLPDAGQPERTEAPRLRGAMKATASAGLVSSADAFAGCGGGTGPRLIASN